MARCVPRSPLRCSSDKISTRAGKACVVNRPGAELAAQYEEHHAEERSGAAQGGSGQRKARRAKKRKAAKRRADAAELR